MSARPASRRLPARLVTLACLVLVIATLGACAGPGRTGASFDASAPCPAEGQQPGAFPDLEALLPAQYDGRAPDSRDSGRSCSRENLGSLADAGIGQLRFAGATWKTGGTSGLTMALFEADGLDATKMRDFYEMGARTARRTEKLQVADTTVGGAPAKRLDVLGSDGTGQTIVAWPASEPGRVWVLLAADLGDSKVAQALETFAPR